MTSRNLYSVRNTPISECERPSKNNDLIVEVDLSDKPELPQYAIHGSKVREVRFSQHIRNIPSHFFAHCKNLRTVDLRFAIRLGDSAFVDSGLETIDLPPGIRVIPEATFLWCMKLKSINLRFIEVLGRRAFVMSGIETVEFSPMITHLESTFVCCSFLRTVDLRYIRTSDRHVFDSACACKIILSPYITDYRMLLGDAKSILQVDFSLIPNINEILLPDDL